MIECCNVCEWQVNSGRGSLGGSKTYYGLDRIEIDTRRILIYYLLRLRSAFLIRHFRFKPAVNHLFITHGFAGKSAEFLTNYIDINLFYRGGLMARFIMRRHIQFSWLYPTIFPHNPPPLAGDTELIFHQELLMHIINFLNKKKKTVFYS